MEGFHSIGVPHPGSTVLPQDRCSRMGPLVGSVDMNVSPEKTSVRLRVRSLSHGRVHREVVVKEVLMDCIGMVPANIFCLQEYPAKGTFDVTFASQELCSAFWRVYQEKKDKAPLDSFTAEPLKAWGPP